MSLARYRYNRLRCRDETCQTNVQVEVEVLRAQYLALQMASSFGL